MLIQLTGLSGAGKTSIANALRNICIGQGISVEVVDGDTYRKTICSDLGFTRKDRCENIRRLGVIAEAFLATKDIVIIAAINPYEKARKKLVQEYDAKVVWVKCDLQTLMARDTKGLYKKAMLADGHPGKISNLTGVNDPFEIPAAPDLIIDTTAENIETSVRKLFEYALANLSIVEAPVRGISALTFRYKHQTDYPPALR